MAKPQLQLVKRAALFVFIFLIIQIYHTEAQEATVKNEKERLQRAEPLYWDILLRSTDETTCPLLEEEISRLRAQMEAILFELQTALDQKLALERELAECRNQLEME
ncbi:uncharacterized protein LOC134247730 [Saccostrea cucullata]|uniref:uncharacterized protein LOC134247730 n=1 Tax=Saccostrea cuccullata TaxID=36930 RepID=UPI002ED3CA10